MTPPTLICRAIFFLALLPQLLVLGLGHGVVVCVAPGGHVEFEAVGSGCCSANQDAPANSEDGGFQESDPDCGPCSDLAIVLNSKRLSDRNLVDLNQCFDPVATPIAIHVVLGVQDPAHLFVRPTERHCEPPHLINLRSILLRC